LAQPQRFVKKPVQIEAMHFITNNDDGTCMKEIEDWIKSNGGKVLNNNTDLYIKTPEGDMKASVSDWIIKGVNGEFYPCKLNIFEKTHDQVLD
jgi:hypothetical protein